MHIYYRSMQGMFGVSVSELHLLIKSLINIVDLRVSDDKVLPISPAELLSYLHNTYK